MLYNSNSDSKDSNREGVVENIVNIRRKARLTSGSYNINSKTYSRYIFLLGK